MKTLLLLVGMIGATVAANLLLKLGASSPQAGSTLFSQFINWRILLGLSSFALAACFYILVLHWLPLNVAVSFAAAQYIAVIVASAWVLSEPIQSPQWIGIAFIALGIAIVGWSHK